MTAACTSRSAGSATVDTAASLTPTKVALGGMLDGRRCPAPDLLAHGFDDGTWAPFLDGGGGARVTRDSMANGG